MSFTVVRRIAIAALALPLLLGACADDEPVPKLPDTSSPTSPVTETAEPQPWEEESDDGAVAFTEYWIDLLNGARLRADFAPLKAASTESCETCASFLDVLEQLHGPGGLYESKPWRVEQTGVIAGVASGSAKVAIRVRAPAERVRTPGESEIRLHAATTDTYEATVVWAESAWKMQKLVIPE
jgi:hypothetical protein